LEPCSFTAPQARVCDPTHYARAPTYMRPHPLPAPASPAALATHGISQWSAWPHRRSRATGRTRCCCRSHSARACNAR
jgi:hypothetical protein